MLADSPDRLRAEVGKVVPSTRVPARAYACRHAWAGGIGTYILDLAKGALPVSREEANEIQHSKKVFEITPEMIEAGVLVARTHPIGADIRELVRAVYLAMVLERLD